MARIGFLFPGQGSQAVGMGRDLAEAHAWVRDTYARASETLGFDLAAVSFEGPEEALRQTRHTQPALLVHGAVLHRLAAARGIRPSAAAGHSLGEFSALVAAGALSLESALSLVRERSRLMSEAGERYPGAMAAVIGFPAERVAALCAEAGDVQAANFNSPEQTVVSGTREGVARACALARAAGAKRAVELPVSGAFHSPLMRGAADAFAGTLSRTAFADPAVPVYANVSASAETSGEALRGRLALQMTHPVRWVETVQAMVRDGFSVFVEMGPGRVLAGLVKRIDKSVEVLPCGTAAELEALPV